MGISYPFRFRREPKPPRAGLTLATPDTLNPAMLDAVRAGSGDRIAVIGDGAAFTALADQTRDLLIDPAHGNWDFFADHPSDHARSSAVEAFLPAEPRICAGYTGAYRYVLLRAMEHGGREPGAGLAAVRDLVRALPPEAVAEAAGHDPANGHARLRDPVCHGLQRQLGGGTWGCRGPRARGCQRLPALPRDS